LPAKQPFGLVILARLFPVISGPLLSWAHAFFLWRCLQDGRTGFPVSWVCFEPGFAFRLLGAPPPQNLQPMQSGFWSLARVRTHARVGSQLDMAAGTSPAPHRPGLALRCVLPSLPRGSAPETLSELPSPIRMGAGFPVPAFLESTPARRSHAAPCSPSRLRSPVGARRGRGATTRQLS
jgi:hypothetical protein